MTGIVGGHRTASGLTELVEELHQEPWYQTTRSESSTGGFAVVDHGDKDPGTNRLWEDDRYQAVVYGVVSNREQLPQGMEGIVPKLIEDPHDVLPRLEGPFLIACHDRQTGRFTVATDKLGSRPCYYTDDREFQFGTEVSALLPAVADPTINRDGIADLLLYGAPIGKQTFVEEIRALPPATVLTYDDGDVATDRYWFPSARSYEGSSDRYVADWLDEYQRSVGNLTDTIEGDLGVWLSGGIDSRTTAIALQNERQDFTTFTYETRFASDQPVARQTANALGVRNYQVNSGPPEKLCDAIEKSVEINDAMQPWSAIVALPFMMYELPDFADVVIEGSRFLGEDIWAHSLENRESPTEILLHKKGDMPVEQVERLVGVSNPEESLHADLEHADADELPYRHRVLDAMRRYYGYTHMRSNVIQRSQTGTRVVSDGDIVDVVMNMPDDLRMQTVPGTDGKLPYGVPKVKLEVMRALDNEGTEVPYQRSLVDPSKPFPVHVAGFFAREVKEKLLSRPHHPYLDAYRENPTVRGFVNSLLDDAKRRDVFDADEITAIQRAVLSGEQEDVTSVAAISGVEHWFQTYLD